MISTTGLTKRFGKGEGSLLALDNFTIEVEAGQVFGFIGPNGAGKSTTMKILACLLRPDAGVAKVAGLDVTRDGAKIRRLIGYMPDFLGVYDDLTVDEYLQFFAAAFSIPRSGRRAIVDQVLELTDLTSKKKAMVDSLSRGMQQRLGVARVLIHDPKVLLLDEPASGLDPRARIEMRSLITELGRMGKTLMVSSHILTELAEMCTSIGIIERGKLLYAGSIDDAFSRAKAASQAGERVVVRLEPGSAAVELVRARLEADHRVTRAQQTDDGLTIDLAPGEHGHHFLIEALIASGARIASFEPQEMKLEDAFLKLTTGALQ
ncbi:MAG: ABC transporter ATP-binding protein [Planctomycetota bacterium]|nr:ABC transporter ATP-binding protein [Planctomycetota bacterium]